MSETAVPLWKKELLKRRERKIFKDGSTTGIKASNHATTVATNNFVHENDRKSAINRQHRVPNTNSLSGNTTRTDNASYRQLSESGDGLATRQIPQVKENRLKMTLASNNINQSNESPSSIRNITSKIDLKRVAEDSDVAMGRRFEHSAVSRLGRESCSDNIHSSIHLDESEKERLKALMTAQDRGVTDEHIRPRALKKMWKRQESKEALYPESSQPNKQTSPTLNAVPIHQLRKANPNNLETKTESHVNHIKKAESTQHKQQVVANEVSSTGTHPPGHPSLPKATPPNAYKSAESTQQRQQVVPSKVSSTGMHPPGQPGLSKGPAPKAYKSPYAKHTWTRTMPSSQGKLSPKHERLGNGFKDTKTTKHESHVDTPINIQPDGVALKKPTESTPAGWNKSASVENIYDSKVESEHLPSVKSLLGLFGGKSSSTKKGGKQVEAKKHVSLTPNSAPRPGNLVRHHSEPNLYSPTNDSSQMAVQPQSKIDSNAVTNVAMPSHQVSSGIKERMTLLRKWSISSSDVHEIETISEKLDQGEFNKASEDMVFVGDDPKQKMGSKENEITSRKESKVINETLTSQIQKDVPKKIDDVKVEKPPIKKTVTTDKDEKLSLSIENKVLDRKSSHDKTKPNGFVQEEHDGIPKPSFNKLLSVFGPSVGHKKSPSTDSNASKSPDKITSKQNNYVVEVDQSRPSLVDQVLSTSYSNGIIQNQQENKLDIIKDGSHEVNVEKKQTKSRLNVVDPTEVLQQLTKDPVLLNKKPTESDSVCPKEPDSTEIDSRKPNDKIIKFEPDKNGTTQIDKSLPIEDITDKLDQKVMAVNGTPETAQPKASTAKVIPVTTIDHIPVSSIDDVIENDSKTMEQTDDISEVKLGNATFYNGTLTTSTENNIEDANEEEFIPVSSIDDDSPLLPAPEIVHDNHPEKVKSCLIASKTEKKGNVSFFQHVFIHDYQSETAATSDWDFENGQALSSYTPTALRNYSEIDLPDGGLAPPVTPEEPEREVPSIIYNEEDPIGFSESYDTTAGAMLF